MKIKYVGLEKEKRVEAPKGRIYTFKIGEEISISEPTLCKHLIEKCGGRFVKVEAPKPVKKKKK